jgi:hypothetical protein
MIPAVLPMPANKAGYTLAQVNEIFPEADEHAAFGAWMGGQTMAYIDGQSIVYEEDLVRYVRGIRAGAVPRIWD